MPRDSLRHCQHEIAKAWSDTPHDQSVISQLENSLVRTQITTVAPVALTNGARVRRPASGGITVPSGFGYSTVQIDINLTDADKLSVGATLDLEVYFSFDAGATWEFAAGYLSPNVWHSYGPNGISGINPDGTTYVNPDPTIYVALNGVTGQLVHIEYVAQGLSTAGLTLYGVS